MNAWTVLTNAFGQKSVKTHQGPTPAIATSAFERKSHPLVKFAETSTNAHFPTADVIRGVSTFRVLLSVNVSVAISRQTQSTAAILLTVRTLTNALGKLTAALQTQRAPIPTDPIHVCVCLVTINPRTAQRPA